MKSSVKYLRISAPLISVSGGRFPPAWPQPLPPLRSVQGLRLMLFRQESPPSTPINSYTAYSGAMWTQFFFVDLIGNSSEGEIWRLLENENTHFLRAMSC
ncbi:hypothetical protein X953_00145 [Virgibacillus sp. SK37]|nr:hypothetical protein X953_00145 [Virgibacillus sp. SK37]